MSLLTTIEARHIVSKLDCQSIDPVKLLVYCQNNNYQRIEKISKCWSIKRPNEEIEYTGDIVEVLIAQLKKFEVEFFGWNIEVN